MLTAAQKNAQGRASAPRVAAEIFDADKAAADLAKMAAEFGGRERELRTAVAQHLKAALNEGRAKAEELLLKDRHGRHCAERLCFMQEQRNRRFSHHIRGTHRIQS